MHSFFVKRSESSPVCLKFGENGTCFCENSKLDLRSGGGLGLWRVEGAERQIKGRVFSVDSARMANGLQPPVPCTCICISCRVVLLASLFIFRRVLKIAESDFVVSVRPSVYLSDLPSAWNNSAPTGRIFMKFYF